MGSRRSTGRPRVRAALHARGLGIRTREARWVDFEHDTQDLTSPTGERHVGLPADVGQVVLIYQGSRCCVLLAGEDPVSPERGWTTTPTPTAGIRRCTLSGSAGGPAEWLCDHHAADDRQPVHRGRRGRRVRASSRRRRAVNMACDRRAYERELEAPAVTWATMTAPSWPGGVRAAVDYRLKGERVRGSCRRRPPRTAPGSCTWRPDYGEAEPWLFQRRPASTYRAPRGTIRPGNPGGERPSRGGTVFDANPWHHREATGRAALVRGKRTRTLTRLWLVAATPC